MEPRKGEDVEVEVEEERKEEDEERLAEVPKTSLDYFFLGASRGDRLKTTVAQMTTKELRKKHKIAQLPTNGGRAELENIYENFRRRV